MSDPTTTPPVEPAADPAKWAALAAPFPADQIETLPKQVSRDDRDRYQCRAGTKASADGKYCGGYHARSVHLDYVGHAGVTMRLNEVDPGWSWEPLAWTPQGTPLIEGGTMWIRMTVLGVTRIGFGDAAGKTGPNATKELIGDAIRNAAMRFGVATYLWSKAEAADPARMLQADADSGDTATPVSAPLPQVKPADQARPTIDTLIAAAKDAKTADDVRAVWKRADAAGLLTETDPTSGQQLGTMLVALGEELKADWS